MEGHSWPRWSQEARGNLSFVAGGGAGQLIKMQLFPSNPLRALHLECDLPDQCKVHGLHFTELTLSLGTVGQPQLSSHSDVLFHLGKSVSLEKK